MAIEIVDFSIEHGGSLPELCNKLPEGISSPLNHHKITIKSSLIHIQNPWILSCQQGNGSKPPRFLRRCSTAGRRIRSPMARWRLGWHGARTGVDPKTWIWLVVTGTTNQGKTRGAWWFDGGFDLTIGWWLVVGGLEDELDFPIYWECHHPLFRGVA